MSSIIHPFTIVDRCIQIMLNEYMAISDNDIKKISKALLPRIGEMLDEKISSQNKKQTSEIKQYIHEGVDAVVEGVDNLLKEKDYDSRISKLEKLHPQGRHQIN